MDGLMVAILFLMLMTQFSVITLSAISIAVTGPLNLIQVLMLWFLSLIVAITAAHIPFYLIAMKVKRLREFFEKQRVKLEKMLGRHGTLLAMVMFSTVVWLYIAVPVMTLMGLRRSHIYLAAMAGNCIFFLPLILFTGTCANLFDPMMTALIALTVATVATMVISYKFK
ncbi:MAG: hypothetical protein ACTSXJ_09320 [Candidatus Baldrarchaeia archaeon]